MCQGKLKCGRRHFYRAETIVRNGQWSGLSLTDYFGVRVTGKTLGIVGPGRIGRAVAARARGFDLNILYFKRTRDRNFETRYDAEFADTLPVLLERSDIVTLHCPLTEGTTHLIDRSAIRKMKPGAVLINTARGAIVDETALAEALLDGHLLAAGLDVYETEPDVAESLRTMEQVTLLPHIGTATRECRIEMGMRVARNIESFATRGYVNDEVDGQRPARSTR